MTRVRVVSLPCTIFDIILHDTGSRKNLLPRKLVRLLQNSAFSNINLKSKDCNLIFTDVVCILGRLSARSFLRLLCLKDPQKFLDSLPSFQNVVRQLLVATRRYNFLSKSKCSGKLLKITGFENNPVCRWVLKKFIRKRTQKYRRYLKKSY